jgi:hypothetical protein
MLVSKKKYKRLQLENKLQNVVIQSLTYELEKARSGKGVKKATAPAKKAVAKKTTAKKPVKG